MATVSHNPCFLPHPSRQHRRLLGFRERMLDSRIQYILFQTILALLLLPLALAERCMRDASGIVNRAASESNVFTIPSTFSFLPATSQLSTSKGPTQVPHSTGSPNIVVHSQKWYPILLGSLFGILFVSFVIGLFLRTLGQRRMKRATQASISTAAALPMPISAPVSAPVHTPPMGEIPGTNREPGPSLAEPPVLSEDLITEVPR
ncbi:hypothetical protein FB45DRAFT_530994 [Roridomyces roridus]|uniref:Transmembrane protein n=1 Tax=Roridomyces roridus TaxID=1738132 RepID=A0AAD7FKM9_9AGAR|nr:hypothetical protein FB45DRAFT_530994 [Roridomyces roridus]